MLFYLNLDLKKFLLSTAEAVLRRSLDFCYDRMIVFLLSTAEAVLRLSSTSSSSVCVLVFLLSTAEAVLRRIKLSSKYEGSRISIAYR